MKIRYNIIKKSVGRLGEENDDGEELLGNISLMFDLKIGFFFGIQNLVLNFHFIVLYFKILNID